MYFFRKQSRDEIWKKAHLNFSKSTAPPQSISRSRSLSMSRSGSVKSIQSLRPANMQSGQQQWIGSGLASYSSQEKGSGLQKSTGSRVHSKSLFTTSPLNSPSPVTMHSIDAFINNSGESVPYFK